MDNWPACFIPFSQSSYGLEAHPPCKHLSHDVVLLRVFKRSPSRRQESPLGPVISLSFHFSLSPPKLNTNPTPPRCPCSAHLSAGSGLSCYQIQFQLKGPITALPFRNLPSFSGFLMEILFSMLRKALFPPWIFSLSDHWVQTLLKKTLHNVYVVNNLVCL